MFFTATNIQELKKEYKTLVKLYHPDNGGDEEIIKTINAEYDEMLKKLTKEEEQDKINWDDVHAFKDTLKDIINIEGIVIEIIGSWIWVSGNTKPVRKELKESGFKWSKKKGMWHWHKGEFRKWGKYIPISDIRAKYGSDIISNSNRALTGGA